MLEGSHDLELWCLGPRTTPQGGRAGVVTGGVEESWLETWQPQQARPIIHPDPAEASSGAKQRKQIYFTCTHWEEESEVR